MLYVNLCDLDDDEYAISDEDKAFTRSFYGLGGKWCSFSSKWMPSEILAAEWRCHNTSPITSIQRSSCARTRLPHSVTSSLFTKATNAPTQHRFCSTWPLAAGRRSLWRGWWCISINADTATTCSSWTSITSSKKRRTTS